MKSKIILIFISAYVLVFYSCSNSSLPEPEAEKIIYHTEKATSNGDNWNLLVSLPTLIEKHSARLDDISCDERGNIYAATSGGGVYKINSNDKSVNQITNGLIPTSISNYNVYYTGSVLFNDNRIISGSTNLTDLAGIYTSNDGIIFQSKINWTKYANVVSLCKSPNGEIFAGCYLDILRSKDNGDSWISELSNTESGFGYFYTFAFDKYGDLYGATTRGVYYSDSRKIQLKSIGLYNETVLGIDINNNGWIYASTSSGKMFYSKDSGLSWQQLNNFPGKLARCIYINKNNYVIAGTVEGVYRSKDNGDTWESVGLINKSVQKIIMDSQGNLVAGTYMNEIYYSSQ